MKFADFSAGQVFEAGPVSVTDEEIVEFAKSYDPQWFHVDAEAAAQGPYGSLIASGWQTCGLAMRLAVQTLLVESDSFGSPGLSYVKWLTPVRAGDQLRLKASVLETRRTSKGHGLLRWRWQLFNQHGAEVLDLEAASLFQ